MKQQYQIFTVMLLFLLTGVSAFAQQKTVSGTVKDSESKGMPGVNVLVKGTTSGTTTDVDGNFTISMPQEATTLVFSFIGYASQEIEIGSRTSIDVTLTEDVNQLNEVVVTALGIQRDRKALQYSVTEVKGDNFTQARENNIGNALVGRIAGVNVSKVASGPAGSSRIIIRGNKTLGGQNQPLYVVDGVPIDNSSFGDNQGQAGVWGGQDQGNGLSSINPDDIESITVLKGANAAALYGSRGGNGVINIVTKKGAARRGVGIEFSSNYVAETVMNLSDLQQKYGAGDYTETGEPQKPETARDAFAWGGNSWGPRMDGSPTVGIDGVTRPYSYAGDNWKRFYRTGSAWTNSVAMTGGSDKLNFRLGVSDLRSTSVVPNSGFDRTNATLTANAKLGAKISVNAKMMYTNEYAKNRPTISDSPGNAIQAIWVRPPSVNIDDLRGDPNKLGAIPEGVDPALLEIYGQGDADDSKFAGQELLPAANNWGQNPWWAAYQHINSDKRDRVIASTQIRYDITSFLYASGRIGMDWLTRRNTQLVPEGVGYNLGGSMTEGEDRTREINMDWMLGFNKTYNKIQVNAFVGGNKMVRSNERLQDNGTGFSVPFQAFINNSKLRAFTYNYGSSQINSLFGSAEVSYNNYLFLTATGRQDWFSVLNADAKNHVFYPSVGASFVASDAIDGLPSWLSFAKVRASWAQVGIVNINPYDANLTYSLNGSTHLLHTMATFTSAQNNNGNRPNPDLKPAVSTELEFGIETKLFNNRLGLDLTYYSQRTTDDILRATISRASGFGTTDVNVGELTNKGVEILLTGTPVRSAIMWDISLNLAKNVNKVVSLLPEQNVTELVMEEPRTRNVFIKNIVGQPFGTITGRVQQTLPDGTPIFQADGTPLASANYVPIGNGLPDWTGGLNNAFSYKGVNLSFLIDFKFGGDVFSGTNNRLTQWGLHKQSLLGREGEAPLHITGVVKGGSDDAPTYTPVDRDLTPREAYDYWIRVGGEATAISTMFLYDASFIKLRQLTLGYTLPRAWLTKTPIVSATISLVGRNLAILYKDIDNVDPESNYSANAGAQALDYFGFPTTRSYGFNVNLSF